MNIPVEEYNVAKLAAMCKAIKTEADLQPCQAYIQQYFFHTFYGIYHFDVKHLNFVRIDDANIKQYLPTGLKGPAWLNPKWRARQWLVDDVFDRYTITMKLNAPPIDFDKKVINLMGRLKHGDVGSAKYDDCSDQEKAAVELMLNHTIIQQHHAKNEILHYILGSNLHEQYWYGTLLTYQPCHHPIHSLCQQFAIFLHHLI